MLRGQREVMLWRLLHHVISFVVWKCKETFSFYAVWVRARVIQSCTEITTGMTRLMLNSDLQLPPTWQKEFHIWYFDIIFDILVLVLIWGIVVLLILSRLSSFYRSKYSVWSWLVIFSDDFFPVLLLLNDNRLQDSMHFSLTNIEFQLDSTTY